MDVTSAASTTLKNKTARSYLFWKICFVIGLSVLLLEGTLRVAQKLGVITDLEMPEASLTVISDELNHVPAIDHVHYDEFGLKNYSTLIDEAVIHQPQARKILFMGDSFMEGLGGKDDLAWHVWDHYQRHQSPMVPINAGHSSYAPSIYIPQARKLLPHVKPNQVILTLDQTDLADDAYRYESFIVRDAQGRNVAVKHTPVNLYVTQHMVQARTHLLYLARLIHKQYVTQYGVYRFDNNSRSKLHARIFALNNDSTTEGTVKYKNELAIFERNLRELADVLIQELGSENIMWVCHPRPHHFTTVPGQSKQHRLVSETAAKIASEKKIHFYDSTADLAQIIGNNYRDYYLDDPNFHFNPKGIAAYGQCIYEHLPATWTQPLTPAAGSLSAR